MGFFYCIELIIFGAPRKVPESASKPRPHFVGLFYVWGRAAQPELVEQDHFYFAKSRLLGVIWSNNYISMTSRPKTSFALCKPVNKLMKEQLLGGLTTDGTV